MGWYGNHSTALPARVDRPVRETERKHGQGRKFCGTIQAHAMALHNDHNGNCGDLRKQRVEHY